MSEPHPLPVPSEAVRQQALQQEIEQIRVRLLNAVENETAYPNPRILLDCERLFRRCLDALPQGEAQDVIQKLEQGLREANDLAEAAIGTTGKAPVLRVVVKLESTLREALALLRASAAPPQTGK